MDARNKKYNILPRTTKKKTADHNLWYRKTEGRVCFLRTDLLRCQGTCSDGDGCVAVRVRAELVLCNPPTKSKMRP